MTIIHQTEEGNHIVLLLQNNQGQYALKWLYQIGVDSYTSWVDKHRMIQWAVKDQSRWPNKAPSMFKFIRGYFPEEDIILATLETL